MTIWIIILAAVVGLIVGFLFRNKQNDANRKFQLWKFGGESMLVDYDKENKQIDKFSR